MMNALPLHFVTLLLGILCSALVQTTAAATSSRTEPTEPPPLKQDLSAYFRAETSRLEQRCLADITSLSDWTARRETLRRELRDMLGLEPLPPRTDLHPVITGTIDQDDFTVEKLHFQAMPRLYVTANLYLPKRGPKPAPAILYVCGHARMATNGISSGNKSWYQHHGAWFARNGYVCLLIDTLQLGEIEGLHHGTYREGQWWWNSRGYTPAGVEAWFGIRALDYLCSRPEVDPDRIGMTGRSGGGSYTWTVAALDDRVKVAAPVAGITDLRNQVGDGVVEGHCDCMFYLNTYRWDFPQLAALIAPRPLLIANSDKDTIFPIEGVVRLHAKTRRIYDLYRASGKLGILITEGPHSDTQDLQLPVFRWFNRFLKNQDPIIETAAKKFIAPEQLRVFDQLPSDQINTTIQDLFVSAANPAAPSSPADILEGLRRHVFAGWPEDDFAFEPVVWAEQKTNGLRCQFHELQTQPGIRLNLQIATPSRKPSHLILTILDPEAGPTLRRGSSATSPLHSGLNPLGSRDPRRTALAYFAPRALDPSGAITNQIKLNHLRRRYMLLGQTVDSMRVWDIRCALQAIHSLPEFAKAKITLRASSTMAVNAAYAALFQPEVTSLELASLPDSHKTGPDYLNILKICDLPQILDLLKNRTQLTITE